MLKQKNKCKRGVPMALLIMVCLFLSTCGPTYVLASDSSWDAALISIEQMHDTFSALESTNKLEKQQIQELHKQNSDKLKEINTRVQLIDKVKLDKLKTEADQAQKKYAPLLTEYTELGRKATEARKRKDSKSVLLFDLKRNRIKPSVNNARQEIQTKKDAYASAKKQAAAKAKIVNDVIAEVQALKKQITAENLKITEWNKERVGADKRYHAAVKLGNAVTVASEFKLMIEDLNRIHDSQKKLMSLERAITQTLRTAEAKLPS
ncbi:hypothetical protein MUG84_24415 [Paenibacillus sp. KQZ6P-2]|uniref:Uncharacterized protein n=1 Tax=Paenibacillus mangrovi TaxID=2931978 RepID=A0A9X1WT82_9BACL|nr:hypothetical protein [Paenibacillus mangrovi]MCJ8014832.1 hypothetical protein [Paenibacillus mangrovi]